VTRFLAEKLVIESAMLSDYGRSNPSAETASSTNRRIRTSGFAFTLTTNARSPAPAIRGSSAKLGRLGTSSAMRLGVADGPKRCASAATTAPIA
jgi:hypothetical protein